MEGITKLHELIATHHPTVGDSGNPTPAGEVVIGIETDRGPWVAALVAAGYLVYAPSDGLKRHVTDKPQ